jgi:hypothetical protein
MSVPDYSAIHNLTEEQVSSIVAYILDDMCDASLEDAIAQLIADGEENGSLEEVIDFLPTDDRRKLIALYYGECIEQALLDTEENE